MLNATQQFCADKVWEYTHRDVIKAWETDADADNFEDIIYTIFDNACVNNIDIPLEYRDVIADTLCDYAEYYFAVLHKPA